MDDGGDAAIRPGDLVVTIYVIIPVISRAQDGRVREHPRLDYEWYTARFSVRRRV